MASTIIQEKKTINNNNSMDREFSEKVKKDEKFLKDASENRGKKAQIKRIRHGPNFAFHFSCGRFITTVWNG